MGRNGLGRGQPTVGAKFMADLILPVFGFGYSVSQPWITWRQPKTFCRRIEGPGFGLRRREEPGRVVA